MTSEYYKGYTIRIVGISHYIFRPGTYSDISRSQGYEQSYAAAKRWINEDLKRSH